MANVSNQTPKSVEQRTRDRETKPLESNPKENEGPVEPWEKEPLDHGWENEPVDKSEASSQA